MSIEGKIKDAAGFAKEELFERGDSPKSRKRTEESRNLRNESRIEEGEAPKKVNVRSRQIPPENFSIARFGKGFCLQLNPL